jgi:hypothetical protein
MRVKIVSVITAVLSPVLFAAICAAAQDVAGPSVFFPQTQHEFAPVLEGTKVVHDFVIQNKGTETLNIERVRTG